MARKKGKDATVQPDGTVATKPSFLQNVGAALAGIVAVKLATYLVTTIWQLVTREDPPDLEQAIPPAKKVAWIAVIGATTGAARQMARDWVKPPTPGAA